MAIQNFPEGAAVSLPMKTATGSRGKAFLYGMGSGAVEPVFAVIGYFLAANLTAAQPWFLAFAAGAMIFVVVEDLIPDAHLSEHPHLPQTDGVGERPDRYCKRSEIRHDFCHAASAACCKA